MKDISSKISTLRTAKAISEIKINKETIIAIKKNSTPKKDVFATARAAGFLAIKNTSLVIPHCHPIPIDSASIDFKVQKDRVIVTAEVKSIYKTGCEMEALYGVSVAALTIYDMLKPIDKDITIINTRLLYKSGGKSDFKDFPSKLKAAVVVISDSIAGGKAKDTSGIFIKKKLETFGIKTKKYLVISDDKNLINKNIKQLSGKGFDLIITTGGTGVSPRDNTFESIKPLIEKEIPGIIESARSFGQKKTPFAMLSKGTAGFIGKTLVITLPGSLSGVSDSMEALFPYILHVFKVLDPNYKHSKSLT